jgi:hypothetical protein
VAEVAEAAEPLVVAVGGRRTEGFIEVVEAGTRDRVVTVIEVLSPSNKRPGPGRTDYLRKLARGRINAVEIDLVRGGRRGLAPPSSRLPKSHRTPYLVAVRRGRRPDLREVYRAPLGERLPAIRVPLRRDDADVTLELQPLVDLAYRNGRYAERVDYRAEPDPPLDPEDAAWADTLLKARGLR